MSIRFLTSGIRAGTHFLHKETPSLLVNCENRLIGTFRLHRLVSCSIEDERGGYLGLASHFDGTGYPRWKVLMKAYLQAKDLDVWRVTNEGMKNGTKKEKQFDVIARSIILSSLDVGIFNRVFNCENAHELWKTIKEKNEGSKEVANERYGCLLEEFNSFKQLANENVEAMYSRLNVLVNEINALSVKNITDLNINRKILQSLRKPDYDLVKEIIYEKKLEDLKPSHILSKIMAHELQIMPK
jgi:hypothetical protein